MPTTDEQIRYALEQYGLHNASYTVLRDLENTVLHAKLEGLEFGVRICSPGVERDHLEVELDWLEALRRDTALMVPRPVLNRQGNRITVLDDRLVVVFDWLQGQPVSHHMSLETARAIGQLTASLHQHTQRYKPNPDGAHRIDRAWLNGPDAWWTNRAATDLPEDHARLEPCIAFVADVMERLGESSEHFGLIHTDLHFGNILLHDGVLRVIDFGDCALGHYLFDLGVTEAEFMDSDDGPALVEAFRSSYEQARGVTINPRDLAAFRILGSVAFLEWVFTSPNQSVRDQKLPWVHGVVEFILEAGECA